MEEAYLWRNRILYLCLSARIRVHGYVFRFSRVCTARRGENEFIMVVFNVWWRYVAVSRVERCGGLCMFAFRFPRTLSQRTSSRPVSFSSLSSSPAPLVHRSLPHPHPLHPRHHAQLPDKLSVHENPSPKQHIAEPYHFRYFPRPQTPSRTLLLSPLTLSPFPFPFLRS